MGEDDKTLDYYGLKSGNELFLEAKPAFKPDQRLPPPTPVALRARSPALMSIAVKTTLGGKLMLSVRPTITIEELKKRIHDHGDILGFKIPPPGKQLLTVFDDISKTFQFLTEGARALNDYTVVVEGSFILVEQMPIAGTV